MVSLSQTTTQNNRTHRFIINKNQIINRLDTHTQSKNSLIIKTHLNHDLL